MRASVIFALAPILALAQPNKLVARQDAPIELPEGPLPPCTNTCFGQWGWPITLCTGQEGLNHLIRCFNEECGDEQRRIHAQLAAEQNCEEGMGWPERMPEDLEVEGAAPADEEDQPSPSASASSSAGSGQPTASPSESSASSSGTGPNTGAFDVEGASSTVSGAVESATDSPNGARQTAFAAYAGMAAAAFGIYAAL